MSRLSGKVAVITGGAGEIGSETAKLFAKEGAKVLLVDIDDEKCKKIVSEIGGDAVSYFIADVTKPEQVQAYVQAAVDRYGGIDVFLDNAGIVGDVAPTHEFSVENFEKVMAINVTAVFTGLKYVIPVMLGRGGGSCILSSSILGVRGTPGLTAYTTSKHALLGMMRVAAIEYGPFNVRVNCINPGALESGMMRHIEKGVAPIATVAMGVEVTPEQVYALFIERTPLRRYGTVKDIAPVMLFLASDESRHCTGHFFLADGGMSA